MGCRATQSSTQTLPEPRALSPLEHDPFSQLTSVGQGPSLHTHSNRMWKENRLRAGAQTRDLSHPPERPSRAQHIVDAQYVAPQLG